MSTSEKLFTIQVVFLCFFFIDNAPVIAKRLKISWKKVANITDLDFIESKLVATQNESYDVQFSSVFIAQELRKMEFTISNYVKFYATAFVIRSGT